MRLKGTATFMNTWIRNVLLSLVLITYCDRGWAGANKSCAVDLEKFSEPAHRFMAERGLIRPDDESSVPGVATFRWTPVKAVAYGDHYLLVMNPVIKADGSDAVELG